MQSLTREHYFDERFVELVERPHRRAIVRGIIQSLTFALQSSYVFINFAAAYRYGIWLVKVNDVAPYTVFQ